MVNAKKRKTKKRITNLIILFLTICIIILTKRYYSLIRHDTIEIFPDNEEIKIKPPKTNNLAEEYKNSIAYNVLSGNNTQYSPKYYKLFNYTEEPKKLESNDNIFKIIEQNKASSYGYKLTQIKDDGIFKINNKNKKSYYYCQLLFSLDKNELIQKSNDINSSYKNIINNKKVHIYKEEFEDKHLYLLLIGTFENFENAKLMCEKFHKENQLCLVVKKPIIYREKN